MTTKFAEQTWTALQSDDTASCEPFDPSTLVGLPAPAQRFLTAALTPGTPLARAVELEMNGRIKLVGLWFPFTARQILRAGVGFVWTPVVGGRLIRFVGADVLGPDGAKLEFRLHGHVPIVRAEGPDVLRSAAGRLAAETVAWLPQALTPQAGAVWSEEDDNRCRVTLPGPSGPVEVNLEIDDDGRLRELQLMRWNNSLKPPATAPFGGAVTDTHDTDGVCIAGAGTVGWEWGTHQQHDGEFFRYTITAARFIGPGNSKDLQ